MSNKVANKILKNSSILYSRMLITMIVALFSSRVILNSLGAEDYGIYNIVGGIVGMMGLLNTILISTTNRYIAIEIGKGEVGNINNVFSASIIMHVLLVIFTIILAETVGLYYVKHLLNVPAGKLNDALFVFQFSLVSISISIITVPYLALMTAHEDFGFQSKATIFQSLLTLVVSVLISIDGFNKIRFYAVMLSCVFAVIAMMNIFYVKYHYKHVRIFFTRDSELFKSMSRFSSWMAIGTVSYVLRNQGAAMMLNVFFGAITNAAFAISVMVNAQINQFSQNVNRAFIPQITKCYGSGKIEKSKLLSMESCKYSFFTTFVVAFPVLMEIENIFILWLKNPPINTVLFCRLMIIESLLVNLNLGIGTFVFATGKVKYYQIFTNTIAILNLPISYCLFKLGYPPTAIVFGSILTIMLMMVVRHLLVSRLFNFKFGDFMKAVYLPVILAVLPPLFLLAIRKNVQHDDIGEAFAVVFLSFILCIVSIWFLGFNKRERKYFIVLVSEKLPFSNNSI